MCFKDGQALQHVQSNMEFNRFKKDWMSREQCISEAEEELGIFCNTLQFITVIHNNDLVRSIKCSENSYYKSIIT